MMKKNLILGIIKSYDFETVEPFIVSLKRTGYTGELLLFYSDLEPGTLSRLKGENIRLMPFREDFPYIDSTQNISFPGNLADDNSAREAIPVNTYRFIIWYLYLLENRNKYTNILLTDVRDVIFQKDPFSFPLKEGLSCFIEDESILIRDCSFNGTWFKNVYGSSLLTEIGGLPPSCCGIIMGTTGHMMLYLTGMLEHLGRLRQYHYGDDTAIHNYLVYKRAIEDVHLYKNEEGPVITLVNKRRGTIRTNRQGHVINQNNDIVHIVHQYDRYPELIEVIMKKNGIFTSGRKKKLAEWYFWEQGFERFYKDNNFKNAFKFFIKGLSLSPLDEAMVKTFCGTIKKRVFHGR